MKNNLRTTILSVFALAIFTTFLSSCLEDSCDERRTFIQFDSIFITAQEMRTDVSMQAVRELKNTGKIYFYDNYIFLNEKYEGIHIIDNADPSNPSLVGFYNIPGNIDMAIKGNQLYADNYADLLTIDISDVNQPQIVCRDEEVFTAHWFNPNRGYYARLQETEMTIEVDCSDPNFNQPIFWDNDQIFLAENAGGAGGGVTTNTDGGQVGTGGSLARFTISKDHLYVINNQFELIAFDIEQASKPRRTETTYVDWGIETLFPYGEYLFIGAQAGMFIYDNTNPSMPSYVSEFQHARACDPVFVNDEVAFVTLRDGLACESFTNQLDVIDVSNLEEPTLIKTYEMDNPHGLSVRDNNLYLCEGEHGLKVFDVEDLENVSNNMLTQLKNINAKDVISVSSNHLIVVGDGGLYQYNTSDPENLSQMSFLKVTE